MRWHCLLVLSLQSSFLCAQTVGETSVPAEKPSRLLLAYDMTLPASSQKTEPVAASSSPTLTKIVNVNPSGSIGNAGQEMAKVDIVFLAVSINGVLRDDTIEALQLPNNDLAVAKTDLLTWNLSVSSAEELRFNEHVYVRLRDLPELRWRIDTHTQTLILEARADAFVSHQVALTGDRSPAVTPSPPGGFFNYDVQSDYSNGRHAYSGFYGFSVFGEWGTGTHTSVYRSNMVEGFERNVRLDTTWTIDMPEKRQSIWLGDAISYGGTLGRAVRFGGVRWGTNFGLTPGFSTLALPTIRGEAALPSTLDLYINNNYGSQARVPAGPFDLANVPLVTGQGEIRMAVRDLLGREQIITQPYYASQALLKPGLHDFSVEAGSIREDYGFFSNRYGRSFIAATDRVGVTPSFTRELRAELLSSQQMLSAGGTWLLGTVGTVGLQAAGSRTTQANGWSSGLSFERQAPNFSSNLVARYATRDFRQLGEIEGRSTRLSAALGFGMPFLGGGLGASYARQTTWQDEDNRIVTLSYSRSVGAQSFISIAATRQSGDARATSIVVSFIHALGLRDSVSAIRSKENQRSFTALQLQRNVPAGPGYGYQINAEDGTARRYSAQGTLNNAYARLNAGVAGAEQGATTYRLGAAGAVAMLGGGLYPTRQIDDSFAIVKVGDYANVNVLRENQQVAKTGRQGYAFVTGLRGYQRNRLSIDQADLPFDAEIDQLDMIVTPAMRSGIAINFPVRRMASATARLIYRDGTALPPGTVLRVQGQEKNAITGFDGKVFVSSSDLRVHLQSEGPRACRANLQLRGAAEIVDELGTIVCEESE